MIANQTSNATGGIDIKPDQKGKGFKQYPDVDLRPYNLRMQTLQLEYLSKVYADHRDLSRYINPKRGFFSGYVPGRNAQIDYRLIMDSDPAYFADILSAGMMSGLSSRSQPWFKLGLGIPELEKLADVKQWLADSEKILYRIFAESNIYDCFQGAYEELGIFSTAAFGIYEDYESVIRGRSFTVGEYLLGNDSTGRLNTFARTEWKTVDQIVNEYGWDNCSTLVQNAYEKGQRDTYMQVNYLCEPNDNFISGRENFEGMKYRSTYWEAKSTGNKVLKMTGFNEFPIMASRWKTVTTADTYGCGGPGWTARGDIKSLYRVLKDLFLAVAKVGDPPVIIGAGVEGQAQLIPGGITRNSKETPQAGVTAAYQVNPDIAALQGLVQFLSDKISSRFFADLFMMMVTSNSREMTAREVVEKQKDKLLILGPVVGRVQTDMLGPAISRSFAIASRAGVIPPAPESIQGLPLNIQYIGLLAQAQRMAQTAALEQGVTFVGSVVGVFPEARDLINIDEGVRDYFDSIGVSPKVMRSPDEVAAIRQAQQEQAAQLKQEQDAMATVQGAKLLSETNVGGGGSALDVMTGNTQAGQ
jgi:hypothetical protein